MACSHSYGAKRRSSIASVPLNDAGMVACIGYGLIQLADVTLDIPGREPPSYFGVARNDCNGRSRPGMFATGKS